MEEHLLLAWHEALASISSTKTKIPNKNKIDTHLNAEFRKVNTVFSRLNINDPKQPRAKSGLEGTLRGIYLLISEIIFKNCK